MSNRLDSEVKMGLMDVSNDKGVVKVVVPLEQDANGFPPFNAESLWVKRSASQFVIQNIPFYCVGIAFGDTVTAHAEHGELIFDEVVQQFGYSTVQIIFLNDVDKDSIKACCEYILL